MGDVKKNLLLFFDRPSEPCFMPKGDEGANFDIPSHFFPKKYKAQANKLSSRFGAQAGRTIPVRNIALPDLRFAQQIPFHDQFSLFIPKHRAIAGRLVDTFMGMRDLQDLQAICSYCQLRINPYLFNYSLSVALLHRRDTKRMDLPPLTQTFPDKFIAPKVFRQAREVSTVVSKGPRLPVVIPQNFTASDSEPEQLVAYFREDIAINLHHWHWHLVYPFESTNVAIVNKDRRGELFYYMHQQILARYNAERFCNGLEKVKRFDNLQEPILEGYFPKLNSTVASRAWPPRFSGTSLRDLDRPIDQIRIELSEVERWRDRILDAIRSNSVLLPNGRRLPLDEERGIDILGNIMESSILSPNRTYYGDMHNMGHVFISYSHDPDHRNLEQFGVMGDSATAMRDPLFYRWHAHVDDILQLYKSKLSPYDVKRLRFPGISVDSVSIEGKSDADIFTTHWEQSTVDLGRGLDFTPRGSVLAKFTHLQHDEFNYVIQVSNTTGRSAQGTFRIFMAPISDDNGSPLEFNDQRKLMIELDKFSQPLNTGINNIRRRSVDSSVTIPYERSFRQQSARTGDPGSNSAAEFDFCGCGWPHHMLIPKGTLTGYPVVLFVMVSNWAEDGIQQDTVGSCNDAASYCGIRDRKYPDKRAMGFPFDRPAGDDVAILDDFLQPNMAVTNCIIRFTNEVRERPQ